MFIGDAFCSAKRVCSCHGIPPGLLPIWVRVNPRGGALHTRVPRHAHHALLKWTAGLDDLLPLLDLFVSNLLWD